MATGQTILIVEDCADIAKMEADLLDLSGHGAMIAVDGVQALAILEREPIDLILLDLNLPRLDGQGVLDRLTSHPTLNRIPVIIRSANPERVRATRQVRATIRKPYDVDVFLKAIEQYLPSPLALAV